LATGNAFHTVFLDAGMFETAAEFLREFIRYHDRPTKYIVVYHSSLLRPTWTIATQETIGDAIDSFIESHVRWQIISEPFPTKTMDNIDDSVFILKGMRINDSVLIFQAKNYMHGI
jgi:hypothetical protein